MWDWDGDGNPPIRYDSVSGDYVYDEDDWDDVAFAIGGFRTWSFSGDSVSVVFDAGLNNYADIDIAASPDFQTHPELLQVNGTDINN